MDERRGQRATGCRLRRQFNQSENRLATTHPWFNCHYHNLSINTCHYHQPSTTEEKLKNRHLIQDMDPSYHSHLPIWARKILLELILGGQARLTYNLTPTLHQKAMAKAEGTRKYLPFIPIKNPKQHTQFIGACMCVAGALLSSSSTRTRVRGGGLVISLTLAGVYTQFRMGIPYWLPAVNTVLAAVILRGEGAF